MIRTATLLALLFVAVAAVGCGRSAAPENRSGAAAVAKPAPAAAAPKPAAVYANCTEARAAGVTPLHRGEPGYASKLDRDGDGIACE